MHATNSEVAIDSCTFHDNRAGRSGGAISVSLSQLRLTRSCLSDHTAHVQGGTLSLLQSDATLSTSCVQRSKVDTATHGSLPHGGGGVASDGSGHLIIDQCIFSQCQVRCQAPNHGSTVGGGALWTSGRTQCAVSDSRFVDNSVHLQQRSRLGVGGALWASSRPPRLYNCSFVNNSAPVGGAVCVAPTLTPASSNVPFKVNNTLFDRNRAQFSGGALHVGTGIAPSLTRTTFTGNQAQAGGGVYCECSDDNAKRVSEGPRFERNSDIGGYGANYSTPPRTLQIVQPATGQPLPLNPGGVISAPIHLNLFDGYHQPAVIASHPWSISVHVPGGGAVIIPGYNVTYQGFYNVSGLQLLAPPGAYTLTFTAAYREHPPLSTNLAVSVKQCPTGRVRDVTSLGCIPCTDGTFEQNGQCVPCPSGQETSQVQQWMQWSLSIFAVAVRGL